MYPTLIIALVEINRSLSDNIEESLSESYLPSTVSEAQQEKDAAG
jgi:hypothetical protein